MNRLFVAKKPANIICNHFLSKIKRKYNIKKAGFSGTLDPFASGVLIVAFNQYTKLFRFLKKAPKSYKATLWLGLKSDTLDIDGAFGVDEILPISEEVLLNAMQDLQGVVEFVPPKFSAKKIHGKRAYELARSGKEVELKASKMHVYKLKLLHYNHPFVSFEAKLSEGGYVRSLGEMIAKKIGLSGSLSYLERIKEGEFIYENEKALNPLQYLDMQENFYLGDTNDVKLGKKLDIANLKKQKDGFYFMDLGEEFAIISIQNKQIKYELNKVEKC